MKFFHLSDLHIGLRLMNHDLSEDQAYILQKIIEYAESEKPDAVVIAGDLYDKAVPSAEAVTMFDDFVSGLCAAVPEAEIMMISGNHDSAARVNVFRNVLTKHRIHMIGLPPQNPEDRIECVELHDEYGPVRFYLLPFVRPSMVRQTLEAGEEAGFTYDEAIHRLLAREEIDPSVRNVLVSHQFYLPAGKNADEIDRMESEIKTVGNIDAVKSDCLESFDYAALGHIHKPMKVGSEFLRYCGTPLACSVDEAGQSKGIIEVTLKDKGSVETRVLPLIPLRQVREIRGSFEEAVAQASEDYVRVVLTDTEDLDALDVREQLRSAFPRLLEIRREGLRAADYDYEVTEEEIPDAYELCLHFLPELSDEEKALLQDVVNEVTACGQ